MKVPPFKLPKENNVLLRVIQSIACKEESLASCATAEADRLHALAHIIEKTGYSYFDPIPDCNTVKNNALSVLQVTQAIQQNLKSSSDLLFEFCNLGELCDLEPIQPHASGVIHARGCGMITNECDLFNGGTSVLKELKIDFSKGAIRNAKIVYEACQSDKKIKLEALSDDLEVFFVRNCQQQRSPQKPIGSLIVGTGVAKYTCQACTTKSLVSFAITIWDSGNKNSSDTFRMVIYCDNTFCFVHDSGYVL